MTDVTATPNDPNAHGYWTMSRGNGARAFRAARRHSTMEQPRMAGFTPDARAYELSADAAAQDLTKPDIIELKKIHAKIEMQDKSSVEMTALGGLYDSKG